MQISGLPTRISVPFASSGTKNTIPVDSQIGITAGAASFTDGFPPLTMTSVSAGGVPPYGADFNGILNAITVAIRWNTAGSGYPFNSDFASSVAGYPEGALLPASDYSGYWMNTVDANSTAPENSTAETTGWVPGINYGVTSITGLSGSSVTLTTLQASKSRITLTGTLTANINLIFPAWTFSWTLVNNCTGNFSVTCTTASGTGVTVPTGLTAVLVGDGTNITQDTDVLGLSGRLLNIQVIKSTGTYTKTAGTTLIRVKMVGGGGGGGSPAQNGSGNYSGSGGGSSGCYAEALINASGISTVSCTIGTGGTATAQTAGGLGGTTSFGSYLSAYGGNGGLLMTSDTSTNRIYGMAPLRATFGTVSNATLIDSDLGNVGGDAIIMSSGSRGGCGGRSRLGGGTFGQGADVAGINAATYGGGGGGVTATYSSYGTNLLGGKGSTGVIVVEEYA